MKVMFILPLIHL